MNPTHYFTILLFFFLTTGCTPEFDFGDIDFEPQIIVEGWIENGGVAHVCLTQSLTLNMDTEDTNMANIPIRWAKVTVSDGIEEEILTGRKDSRYTPPFIYQGNRIKGEVGKTYSLKVEYSGRVITASTIIPPVVPIRQISVTPCSENDTLYQIEATFKDDSTQTDFYKAFCQVIPDETRFYASFMGTVSDEVLHNHEARLQINKGMRYTKLGEYTPYYSLNDTALIKLTHLPEEGFRFWSDYENEIINGKNPLFPSNTNLSTNIHGGKGIWCGYGVDTRLVVIKDSI